MALPKRSAPLTNSGPPPEPWVDPEFKSTYPNLHSFMSDTCYAEGAVRLTGSMSLFVMTGALKCCVTDKDRNVIAFVTAPTLDELLQLVDDGICNDSLEWKAGSKAYGANKPTF
jgi:hypothetical protein